VIEKRATIPADHPALPGHFPGNPIVPGVVLLDEVLSALPGRMDIPWAKFHAPLRAAQEFVIRIEHNKFSVHRGETLIASGGLRSA
jgi:3-hydroxymyristoyl/3-hydroxydecanoyl-(acyl carrier protein) dehydratase